MDYHTFLARVIDDGIAAAKRDYSRPDQLQKLEGSIAGFEACRDLQPRDLRDELESSRVTTQDTYVNMRANYWRDRCYEAEVEWVCNVVSAMLMSAGLPTIVTPTARGAIKAA